MRSFGTLLVAGLAGTAIAAPISAGPLDSNAAFQVAKRAPLGDEAEVIAHIMRDIGSIDPDQVISALHRRSQDGLDLDHLTARDVEVLMARTPGGFLSKLGKGKGKSSDSDSKDDDSKDDKFFSKDTPIADPHSYDSYNDLGGNKPAKRTPGGAFSKLGKGKGKGKSSDSDSKDDDSKDDKFFSKDTPIADPHSYDSYNDLGGNKPAKRTPGGFLSKLGKGKGKDKSSDSSSKDDDSKDDKFFSKDAPIADPHSYDSYNDLGGNKPAKRGGAFSKLGNKKGKDKSDSSSKDDDNNDDKFFNKDAPIADPHSYDSYNDLGGNKPAKRTPGGAFSKLGKGKGKSSDSDSKKDDDSNDDKFFNKEAPIADPHSYDSYNDLGGNKPAKRTPGGAFSKLGKGKGKSSDSDSKKDDDSNDDKFFNKDAPIADPNSYDSYNDLGGNKPAKRGGFLSKIGKGKGKSSDSDSKKDDDSNDDKFFNKDAPIADPNSYDSYNDLGGNKPAKRGGFLSKIGKGKGKSSDSDSKKDDDSNDDKFFNKDAPIADPNSYDSYNDLGGNKPAKRGFWSA